VEQNPEEKTKKSFWLPKKFWDALDKEAKSRLRSPTKQLQVILGRHFGLQDIEDESFEKTRSTTVKESDEHS
jgi:hypothetical protein